MSPEEICLFEDVNSTLKTSKTPFLEIFVTWGGLVVVLPDVSTRTKLLSAITQTFLKLGALKWQERTI